MANTQHKTQSHNQPSKISYRFLLLEDTEFYGQFNQLSIMIRPAHLNGHPVQLDVANVTKISRVDDAGWKISQKLKYFIFQLTDGTKIAGLPSKESLSISVPFLDECTVLYKNIKIIEKVT